MSKNKIVKTVSFNKTNEEDIPLLERIENVAFATYVKNLIKKDIRSRKIVKVEHRTQQPSQNDTEIKINGQAVKLS